MIVLLVVFALVVVVLAGTYARGLASRAGTGAPRSRSRSARVQGPDGPARRTIRHAAAASAPSYDPSIEDGRPEARTMPPPEDRRAARRQAMQCPNCPSRFTLNADYAEHLQRCFPRETDRRASGIALARLNEAVDRLVEEFGELDPAAAAPRRLDTAA
jgi:hypothetical protein